MNCATCNDPDARFSDPWQEFKSDFLCGKCYLLRCEEMVIGAIDQLVKAEEETGLKSEMNCMRELQ